MKGRKEKKVSAGTQELKLKTTRLRKAQNGSSANMKSHLNITQIPFQKKIKNKKNKMRCLESEL